MSRFYRINKNHHPTKGDKNMGKNFKQHDKRHIIGSLLPEK